MNLQNYLEENILLIDGAMATYYAAKTGNQPSMCERANLDEPEIIRSIHQEYVAAGAKLIRTNTFAANTSSQNCSFEKICAIIQAAVSCAKEVSGGGDCAIAASIGPISDFERSDDEILNEYKMIIDVFNQDKIDIFWFETFSEYGIIKELSAYAKKINPSSTCAALFSLNTYGYTRSGHSRESILAALSDCSDILIKGFNCGTGSTHLLSQLKKTAIASCMAAVPNAGYPDKIMDRTIYTDNREYFKNNILEIIDLGVSIIGGCCGTTPGHIKLISDSITDFRKKIPVSVTTTEKEESHVKAENSFYDKLIAKERMIAVELDPPFDADISKIMTGSAVLKEAGADLITIADSPLGRSRVDSIIMAAKIRREIDIEVMPHICCRDKNLISLRATVLGAYIENIRNFLIVTGDPVSGEERNNVKSVFNFNSIKLMEFVSKMKVSLPPDDQIRFGGALNPRVSNTNKLIERLKTKTDAGAEFFLTQPIFNTREAEILDRIRTETGAYIFAGIMPLVSYRNAMFIHNEFPGIDIPEYIRNAFSPDMSKEDAETVGVMAGVDISRLLDDCTDGFYFITPFNRAGMIRKILKEIK